MTLPDTAHTDYQELSETVGQAWPAHPGPGFRTDPRYDQHIINQLKGTATTPSMAIPHLHRGEPLTRVCDHCYGVAGTHFPHCTAPPK